MNALKHGAYSAEQLAEWRALREALLELDDEAPTLLRQQRGG